MLVSLKYLTHSMSLCQVVFRPVYYGTQDYGNNFAYLMSKVHEYNVQNLIESYQREGEEFNEYSADEYLKELGQKLSTD